jgi:hypothetical protein
MKSSRGRSTKGEQHLGKFAGAEKDDAGVTLLTKLSVLWPVRSRRLDFYLNIKVPATSHGQSSKQGIRRADR